MSAIQAAGPGPDAPTPACGAGPVIASRSVTVFKGGLAVLYLVAAFFWSMPPGFPGRERVMTAADPAFQALGLWQAWDMFAPDPTPYDFFASFTAELDDGGTVARDLSNMPALDLPARYAAERWRRFWNDRLRLDASSHLWPGAANWLRGRLERETGRRVTRVVLWRNWRLALPPPPPGEEPWQPEWTRETFYDSGEF